MRDTRIAQISWSALHQVPSPKRRIARRPRTIVLVTYTMASALLLANNAIGQGSQPEPHRVNDLASHRFEFGLTSSIALGQVGSFDHEDSAKLFIGASGTFAPRPWLAVGAAIEFLDAFQNNSDCYGCVRRGVLTLLLGELRLPLGTEHVRLFGRFATGPVFAVGTDERSTLRALAKTSVGLDLRLWHVYARPFAFVAMMTQTTSQIGPGLEVGASF